MTFVGTHGLKSQIPRRAKQFAPPICWHGTDLLEFFLAVLVPLPQLFAGPTMTHLDDPIMFLATADAARSRAFYERVLGLKFVADEWPALVFQVGDRMLRIQKVDRVQAAPYTALGWAVSDIRQTVRDLHSAGVVFQRYPGMNQDAEGIWQSPGGASIAWFQDPDGHVLSLTQFAR
jgi:catechol 2,3-dioxygenase-like lactoylglutathione lyase family enzyme